MTPRHIETHQHTRWTDIVGNATLKSHLMSMARMFITDADYQGQNTLVVGRSRSGKTSTVELFINTVMCRSPDTLATLAPCGSCDSCITTKARIEEHTTDRAGLMLQPNGNIGFIPIDGNRVTTSKLDDHILYVAQHDSQRWIIYIDEIQGLVRRHLDHTLLREVEHPRVTWIITTATTKGVEPMLLNRFTAVKSELPTTEELAMHIASFCTDHANIYCDCAETITRLVDRCGRVPGQALKCLASAKANGSMLTRELVDHFTFAHDVE